MEGKIRRINRQSEDIEDQRSCTTTTTAIPNIMR